MTSLKGFLIIASMKKSIGVLTPIFILIVFIVCSVFYFFGDKDNLINYLPDNIFFYVHFNLNRFNYAGFWGERWFNGEAFLKMVKELSNQDENQKLVKDIFDKRKIDFFKEMSIVGYFWPSLDENKKKDLKLIFIFKTKRDVKISLVRQGLEEFFITPINSRVLAISSEPVYLKLNKLPKRKEILENFSFFSPLFPEWGKGVLNLKALEIFNFQPRVEQEIKFTISSPYKRKSELIFRFKKNGQMFSEQEFLEQRNSFQNSDLGWVLIFPQETVDLLERKIKIRIAFQSPIEEEITLPDGTKFLELKVDPNKIEFKREILNDKEIHYWIKDVSQNTSKEENQEGIFIWKEGDAVLISNRLFLCQTFIKSKEKSPFILEKNKFQKGIYFFINKFNLKDIVVVENLEEIKGRLRLGN